MNLGRIDRQRRENEESISAMKSKFVELEGRMCNGVYLWRITGYARHLENARDNAVTTLHSPSFYTSFYGYKLCVRYVEKILTCIWTNQFHSLNFIYFICFS